MRVEYLLWRRMNDYGISSMTQLSLEIGCGPCYISRVCSGENLNISPHIRREICRVLDIAPEVLDEAILESLKAR